MEEWPSRVCTVKRQFASAINLPIDAPARKEVLKGVELRVFRFAMAVDHAGRYEGRNEAVIDDVSTILNVTRAIREHKVQLANWLAVSVFSPGVALWALEPPLAQDVQHVA